MPQSDALSTKQHQLGLEAVLYLSCTMSAHFLPLVCLKWSKTLGFCECLSFEFSNVYNFPFSIVSPSLIQN